MFKSFVGSMLFCLPIVIFSSHLVSTNAKKFSLNSINLSSTGFNVSLSYMGALNSLQPQISKKTQIAQDIFVHKKSTSKKCLQQAQTTQPKQAKRGGLTRELGWRHGQVNRSACFNCRYLCWGYLRATVGLALQQSTQNKMSMKATFNPLCKVVLSKVGHLAHVH